jgi:predicted ATPase/class 3 adenylate cyclase
MTDIEGSTRLLAELGDGYGPVLQEHRRIVRDQLARHDGIEVETEGDSFFCVFRRAVDAVRATVAVQRCLAAHRWPGGRPVRVRVGLHTGEAVLSGGGYVGMDVHRVARVCAAGHGGQVLLTEPTHALLEGVWPGGVGDVPLGVHRLKDLPAPEVLYQLTAPGLDTRFPPLRSLERPGYALPSAPAPMFGRERDVARVRELLTNHRLVTLTGPGGVGKTRLALDLAGRLADDFPDGVVFVPLAAVRDPALVPDEIARALALPAANYGGQSGLAGLTDHLGGRRMLLVLDNVEQLAEGSESIAQLLQAAPGPRVLATSRGPLRLREEQQYPVEPLSSDAAVEEFANRARAVRPDLALGEPEVATVRRIVDGVGRLPLAVELAAVRVRTLGLGQIADRLGAQLGLLSGGPRDLPRRQQTMRSTLLWSYELLDRSAQRVFAAFAVFPGGATLDALEEVVPALQPDLDPLPALESLVDQGLVQAAPDAGGRFRMLPVVGELAAELLAADDDGPRLRRRAAQRLAALAAEAAPRLVAPDRAVWLDRLQAEHDNLRVALAWATGSDPALAAAIAAPVWRYWQMRGYLREGRAVLRAVLDALPPDDTARRYQVLTALGGVTYWQRDVPGSEAAYREALLLAEQTGDPRALAEALYDLAFALWHQSGLEEAGELAERSDRLFREVGDEGGAARVLWLRGVLAVGNGDLAAAEQLLGESVARHRQRGDAFHLGWSLRMLGKARLMLGRPEAARAPLEEGLRVVTPTGDVSALILHLADFATLAALEGDVERSVRLVGAVRRLRRLTGIDLVDHPLNRVPGLDETLARLGPEGERLLAEGAAMTDAEVIAYALQADTVAA